VADRRHARVLVALAMLFASSACSVLVSTTVASYDNGLVDVTPWARVSAFA